MSSNPLLVGVDVHRKTNTICLMNRDGQEVGQRFIAQNNRQGTAALARAIDTLATEEGYDSIQIAAEATGWYWWHFFQMLDQDTSLNQRPLALYSFNPRLIANFRKTYSDLDKTDLIDAFVIADRLRLGRDLLNGGIVSNNGPAGSSEGITERLETGVLAGLEVEIS